MFGWTEVRQQRGHFVKWTPSDRFLIAATRQIVADFLLMRPKQSMQCQHVCVRYEAHAVRCCVNRLTIRCNLNEESVEDTSC